jgi:hypothetical protein
MRKVNMSDAKDLDETRRLLYGALAASRTPRWELVGTLVNALAHHSGLIDDPYRALDTLVALVVDGDRPAEEWAKSLIAGTLVSGSVADPADDPDGVPEGAQ